MAMFSDVVKNFSLDDFPTPDVIDPASVPSLRWGIIGAGDIADVFINTLQKHTKQQVAAIASKTPGKAELLGQKYGISRTFNSYEELCAQPDIDVIYIATLPNTHLADSLIAINAGKHLLVEKPSAISKKDAELLYSSANKAGVFAMEAMWSRYLPQASMIRKLVSDKTLGEIELIQADFGQDNRAIARLWLPGASIMQDMGIYPIAFVTQILGIPKKISAAGQLHSPHSEAMASAVLEYESGARAVITVSGYSHVPTRASVSGTEGVLLVDSPFFTPSGLGLREAVFNGGGPNWRDETDVKGHEGLCYQANYLASYVSQGLLESPLHTHAETVAIIGIGEEIRRIIGVKLDS
ncbi:MviM Predicted dehydrogenases and related proteins [Candidatus Nanopelagicaceae bacterium]